MLNALVLDDNCATADSMVRVLEFLGIQAYAAYTPHLGMSILRTIKLDMIFLDINMPGVSGLEILSYIKCEPCFAHIPVFICTSDDQPQTEQLALQNGASDFLLKPVTIDVMETALRRAGLLIL